MLRDAFLFVRGVAPNGGPSVPASFTSRVESGGWHTIVTDDGVRLASWRANTNAIGQGLFLLLGQRAKLTELAAAANAANDPAAPLKTVWDARTTSALALAVMRYWRDWRCTGFERITDLEGGSTTPAFTNQVRRLIPEGAQLPDPNVTPPPWNLSAAGTLTTQALARYRVTAIAAPALLATMAGWTDHEDAEATT